MFRKRKMKSIVIYSLVVIFILQVFSASIVFGQPEPVTVIQKKLSGISEEEKKILQNLFTLTQEIEAAEQEEKSLAQEIKAMNQEIKGLEAVIAGEEAAYEKKREGLKQVLRSYQRMGPGSYLEIILDSDSLTTFLRRLNTLRDLTRNTGELLESLEKSKEELSAQKSGLTEKLVLLKTKQEQSKESLNKKLELKKEREDYLASLKGEREYYQKHLTGVQQMWDELKPLFSNTAREFSSIIEKGEFPPDALKITFSFFRVKGSIEEKVFNDIISKQANLPRLTFTFQPDKITIELPDKNLILSGDFVIIEGNILKFQAKEGSFYGMPLKPESIEELFRDGDLVFNLKPLLGSSTLQSVEIQEGKLELLIIPDLF
ncbi:MAG: coiled-coil domain-containing protein [Caulobacteraceae bacterium]